MAARREESIYLSDSDDTDTVSLADTAISDDASEYELDYILGERQLDTPDANGDKKPRSFYLIKWSGYSKYRASWEPEECLANAKGALNVWKKEKEKFESGSKPRFDIDSWERELDQLQAKRLRRHRRRNKKRAKLGESEIAYLDVEEDEAHPHSDATSRNSSTDVENSNKMTSNVLDERDHKKAQSRRMNTVPTAAAESQPQPAISAGKELMLAKPIIDQPLKLLENRRRGNKSNFNSFRMSRGGPLNAARPNKGNSSSTFKNVFDAGRSVAPTSPVTRARDSEKFRNLSHRNSVRKKLRQEATPDLKDLALKDLTTGERVLIATPHPTTELEQPIVTITSPASAAHECQPSSSTRTASEDLTVEPSVTLTCWYWKNSRCYDDRICDLAHHDTGVVEFKNRSQRLITCQYWLQGKCLRPQTDCIYAHKITNYVADLETSCVRALDKAQAQVIVQKRPVSQSVQVSDDELLMGDSEILAMLRPKSLTCYYWAWTGRCNKADHECRHAHSPREYIAVPGQQPVPANADTYTLFPQLKRGTNPNTESISQEVPQEGSILGTAPNVEAGLSPPRSSSVEAPEDTSNPASTLEVQDQRARLNEPDASNQDDAISQGLSFPSQPDQDPLSEEHRQSFTIDEQQMFTLAKGKAEKSVFLVFTPRWEGHFRPLARSLQRIDAKVYRGKEGSWIFFHGHMLYPQKSGVIIFQPDFVAFQSVPYLSHFLRLDKFNIFRLRTMQPPEFEKIFPSGIACYFSDSIIQDEPEKVLTALKKLKEHIAKRIKCARILGRPGMMDWLLGLVGDEYDSIKKGTTLSEYNYGKWKAIYELLKNLLTESSESAATPAALAAAFELDQPASTCAPPRDCPLYFLPSGVFMKFDALWQKPLRDSEASIRRQSDALMLDWFSGWASANATEFRRFCFYARETEGVVEEWKAKYPHLIISTMPAEDPNIRYDPK